MKRYLIKKHPNRSWSIKCLDRHELFIKQSFHETVLLGKKLDRAGARFFVSCDGELWELKLVPACTMAEEVCTNFCGRH